MREAAEPVDENQKQQQPQPAAASSRQTADQRQVLVLGVVAATAAASLKLPFSSSSSVTQITKFFWRGLIDLFDCGLRLHAPGGHPDNGVNLVILTQHYCDEENAVDRVNRRRGWC